MKNYYKSAEQSAWPLKSIVEMREVENVYDNKGNAVIAVLECGHSCILTGEAVYTQSDVHCKMCSEGK